MYSAQSGDNQSNQSIDFSTVENDAKSLLSTMEKLGQEAKVSTLSIIELYKIKQLQDTSLLFRRSEHSSSKGYKRRS